MRLLSRFKLWPVFCSWERYFTLAVPHSTQVDKWVSAHLMLGVVLPCTSIPSGGSKSTPSLFVILKLEISDHLITGPLEMARIYTELTITSRNTIKSPQPGLEFQPSDLELSALTMGPYMD